MNASRFAPSTTGNAHPGTLLAGLLAWLDARKHGRRLILRLEDLDPERSTPEKVRGLQEQLAWFGLDFDTVEVQSRHIERHRAVLNQLIAQGRIYACACSRREREALNPVRAADGGLVYPGTCKNRGLPLDGSLPLRLRLDPGVMHPPFVGVHNPAQDPASAMGDPIVWRRDGVPAYHLASVADDIASGVDSIVRGVDLLHSTGIQAQLFQFLGAQIPCYRHHLLLLERGKNSEKFSKFHQSVAVPELRKHFSPEELCGILAQAAGIIEPSKPCAPQDLLDTFSWNKVRSENVLLDWNGTMLRPASAVMPPQTARWHSAAGPAAIGLLQAPARQALFDKPLPEIAHSRFCHLLDADGTIADEVVVLRQNDSSVEVCTHAGPGIRRLITKALESHGIHFENPPRGNTVWDRLAQVACPAAASWLLAHPDVVPNFDPTFLRRDAQILIAGSANAGKSTLINAWCGYERSVVHSTPGTTRDLLRVRVVHRGWGLDLIDSAGLRDTTEDLERSGQDLVLSRFQTADLVLWLDPVDAPPLDPPPAKNILRIQTKIDLRPEPAKALSWSSKHPEGLETLADAVLASLGLPMKLVS